MPCGTVTTASLPVYFVSTPLASIKKSRLSAARQSMPSRNAHNPVLYQSKENRLNQNWRHFSNHSCPRPSLYASFLEKTAEARLPFFAHGTLLWFCSRDGLFTRKL